MKYCSLHIILIISILSCGHAKQPDVDNNTKYFDANQDQFTFLVFDKGRADTFFLKYKPLAYVNKKLVKAFRDSLLSKKNHDRHADNLHNLTDTFSKNTDRPDTSDYNLAIGVVDATLKQGGEKYFTASLSYLFFYECLPAKFSTKWPQDISGNFRFNATFFSLLRGKSKELDELIFGNTGYWDESLRRIFGLHIFNEITPESAIKIRNTILTDKAFGDARFAKDKVIFLEFLANTIAQKWRLILLDWG